MSIKEKVVNLLHSGISYSEIARTVGCSVPTVSYHARKLSIPRKVPNKYNWDEIRKYFNEGHSQKECRVKFGFAKRTLEKAISKGHDFSKKELPIDEFLLKSTSRNSIKRRLLRDGILKYECSLCGIIEWNGKPLSLHLDHINGIRDDHRICNLRLLCPNCHSQTETFGSKNIFGRSLFGKISDSESEEERSNRSAQTIN